MRNYRIAVAAVIAFLLGSAASSVGILGARHALSPLGVAIAGGAVALLAVAWSVWIVLVLPRAGGLGGTFGLAAAGSVMVALTAVPGQIPWVGSLWRRGDPSRYVVVAILLVSWWCLLLLLLRSRITRGERRSAMTLRTIFDPGEGPVKRDALQARLDAMEGDSGGILRRRVKLLLDNSAVPDQAAWLMVEEAAVDAGRLQAAYGPLRALVWAIPALGFIGTAAAMASSIAGVGMAVNPGAQPDPQELMRRVVPNLADAFGITLLALASAIACHFLLALMYAEEEHSHLEANSLVLEILAGLKVAHAPGGVESPTAQLLTELWSLQREIMKVGGQLERLLNGRGYSQTLSGYLYAIVAQLRLINGRDPAVAAVQTDGFTAALGVEDDGLPVVLRQIRDQLDALNATLSASPQPAAHGVETSSGSPP